LVFSIPLLLPRLPLLRVLFSDQLVDHPLISLFILSLLLSVLL
jgi:hypothetical protein